MANQTVVPPGGQFQLPASSSEPLVAFRCAPAFRPYLEEDGKNAAFVIDTPIVYQYIQGAAPISLPSSNSYSSSSSLGKLEYFSANSTLLYLPDTTGSVVKTDLRTGALWTRPADGSGGDFTPFIPQGFYVSFDTYLAKNLSLIDQLKADGFNTIHPIPPYDNATNRRAGLYLIFDMRSNYQNLTAVAQQVQAYSSLPNLLLWETAHEPDGNSDPFTAARDTYDLIYQMDGYHPVSIVLNCEISCSEDAYPIGINATYSPVWHTECTPDFGHCGCDNCKGFLWDIRSRIQTYKNRLEILGYDRTKTVWTTPQAVGSGAYVTSHPCKQRVLILVRDAGTGQLLPLGYNGLAMGLTSLNHGATGNTTTIEGTAPGFTGVVTSVIQPFLVDPTATFQGFEYGGVDAGLWYNSTAYLLIVTNLEGNEVYVPWGAVGLGAITNSTTQVQRIFSVSQNTNATGLNFRPGGVGIYTATPPK
ncbi:hypothetical protein BU15DRAFT_88279 [Melanogaster broomeanus]|nr:hypothetical protein BU15DRAFT_88279 [Melanogaster broomeanus]